MNEQWLIENGVIVTMNPDREILYGASLAIEDNRIAAVGPREELRLRYPQAQRMDAAGKAVLPGLINAHTHLAMSVQKGLTLAFADGLYRIMWPVESSLTAEEVYLGTLAGAGEALKGGSTTVVDHYFFAEQVARATTAVGLRAVIGHTIMSRLGPILGEKELNAGLQFVQDWKDRHTLVTPWLAPHASDTVSQEWLVLLREAATRHQVGLHLHLAQSMREREYVLETQGIPCVKYLERIGFLGPDVLAAHCIFIDEDEIDILARTGTRPLYTPMGHALNGRPASAWKMLTRGAKVLMGTDCVTTNNVMDQWGEMRIAGASQKQLSGDAQAMPSLKILEMCTVDGAEAIGMGGQLGALVPGYLADVILVNIHGLHTAPNYLLLDNLVYCCTGRDVDTVMVNGEIVVQGGRLLRVDEETLIREVEDAGRSLLKRAIQKETDLAWLWKDRPSSLPE